MDFPVLVAVGSCLTAVGLIIRGLLIFLDRRGDRRFAHHVFDQTRSTDGLKGYAELRRAQRMSLVEDCDSSTQVDSDEH